MMGERKSDVYFEHASIDDGKIIFDLRNDPDSGANSFHTEPLIWETHSAWFAEHYPEWYLFKQNDEIIGVCRIAVQHKVGTLSWIISPEYRRRGYGKLMLSSFVKFVKLECPGPRNAGPVVPPWGTPEVAILRAEIKPSNTPSIKIAKFAGLIQINESPEVIEFEY